MIRQGRLIAKISAKDMENRAKVFSSLKTSDTEGAFASLKKKYPKTFIEDGYIRVYDTDDTAKIVAYLMEQGFAVSEITKNKIGLEEYYLGLMSGKEAL